MSAVGSYLAKKRWNPSNLKNVEEVWKRERAAEEEKKKIEELRKEYEQDRNREALDDVQILAGVKKSSSKMGWMYDLGPNDKSKDERNQIDKEEREAFLLGDKSVEDIVQEPKVDVSKSSSQILEKRESRDKPLISAAEAFIRNHEDPLTLIKEKQRLVKAKQELSSKNSSVGHESKKEKKSKKESKKSKKSKRERRHSRSESDTDSEEDSVGDSRARSSDYSRHRTHDSGDFSHSRRESAKSKHRSRSRSPSTSRRRQRSPDAAHDRDKYYKRDERRDDRRDREQRPRSRSR